MKINVTIYKMENNSIVKEEKEVEAVIEARGNPCNDRIVRPADQWMDGVVGFMFGGNYVEILGERMMVMDRGETPEVYDIMTR